MSLSEQYLSKDIALSNFARALALPIRICIIRFILENGNEVARETLHQKIPFKKEAINQHVNDLKHLTIVNAVKKDKTLFYKIDKDLFISMSNTFLNLFEIMGAFNKEVKSTDMSPKPKKEKADAEPPTTKFTTATSFGKFIQEKRQTIGLSQLEFAAKFRLNRSHLSRIESNKKSFKPENLKLLSEVLIIPLPELIKRYYEDKINALSAEMMAG